MGYRNSRNVELVGNCLDYGIVGKDVCKLWAS